MRDLTFVLLAVACFAITNAYVRACGTVVERGNAPLADTDADPDPAVADQPPLVGHGSGVDHQRVEADS